MQFAQSNQNRLQSVMTPMCGCVSDPFWDQSGLLTAPRLSPNCHSPLGGLGLTSAVRSRVAAHWSSWADCIHMIRQRHPSVAETLITGIHRGPAPCFAAVRTCQGTLEEAGLEIPSWRTLAGAPPQREEGAEPAEPKVEWQHRATRCLEDQHLRVQLWPTLTDPVRALMRSQLASALTALPTSRANQTGPTTIPHVVVSTPLPPTPTVLSLLPMWPPS